MVAWVRRHALRLNLGVVLVAAILLLLGAFRSAAADPATAVQPGGANEHAASGTTWEDAAKMFAAALAIGITAMATAITQCRIGSAGVGALAENPKLFGNILVFLVIPETMVILGFVIAALMLF